MKIEADKKYVRKGLAGMKDGTKPFVQVDRVTPEMIYFHEPGEMPEDRSLNLRRFAEKFVPSNMVLELYEYKGENYKKVRAAIYEVFRRMKIKVHEIDDPSEILINAYDCASSGWTRIPGWAARNGYVSVSIPEFLGDMMPELDTIVETDTPEAELEKPTHFDPADKMVFDLGPYDGEEKKQVYHSINKMLGDAGMIPLETYYASARELSTNHRPEKITYSHHRHLLDHDDWTNMDIEKFLAGKPQQEPEPEVAEDFDPTEKMVFDFRDYDDTTRVRLMEEVKNKLMTFGLERGLPLFPDWTEISVNFMSGKITGNGGPHLVLEKDYKKMNVEKFLNNEPQTPDTEADNDLSSIQKRVTDLEALQEATMSEVSKLETAGMCSDDRVERLEKQVDALTIALRAFVHHQECDWDEVAKTL